MKATFVPIIHSMAAAGIPLAIAQINSKQPNVRRIRAMIVALIYTHDCLSQTDIAELLHCTQASVSRAYRQHSVMCRNDETYKNEYRFMVNLYRKARQNV